MRPQGQHVAPIGARNFTGRSVDARTHSGQDLRKGHERVTPVQGAGQWLIPERRIR